MRKWAKSSDNSTIQVSGTGPSINTCNSQQIVLNIIYSTGGWTADSQNYIVGAEITTVASSDSYWNKKYFKVNWIYVDPSSITTPPQNNFYQYFSYIWKPLREYFGVYWLDFISKMYFPIYLSETLKKIHPLKLTLHSSKFNKKA